MCAGEARGERTWRREGSAALESMRMSGGNEKHYQEEQRTRQPEARETAKRREAEEVCERESNGERGNARGYERKEEEDHDDEEDEEEEVMVLVEEEASDAMVRAYRATEGATPCASDEDAERERSDGGGGPITWRRGTRGPKSGACAAGVGTGVHAQTIPCRLSFSRRWTRLPLSRSHRDSPVRRLDPSFFHSPFVPSVSFFLSLLHPALLLFLFHSLVHVGVRSALARSFPSRGRIADHGRARTTQGPAGTLLTRAGVLSIWVIANANKDNTLRIR